jgi:hypothetical protein
MTLAVLTQEQALEKTARSLRVQTSPDRPGLTTEMVAQALRRAVFILGPCVRPALEHGVRRSLTGLGVERQQLDDLVRVTLDALLAYGDILEMRPLTNEWRTSGFILRPAPPTFVARSDGSFVILGVAGDDLNPVPDDIGVRIGHGVLRILSAGENTGRDELATILADLRLVELSERSWLRCPEAETFASHLDGWERRTAAEPPCGAVEGLRILDTAMPANYYTGRWTEPANHTGNYIGRRPQRYGADLWCFVQIDHGRPARFMDIVSSGDRIRPCDIAWRAQMALDAQAGLPQRTRVREEGTTSFLDFFSPLPSWAERRIAVDGEPVPANRALLTYRIPSAKVEGILSFLRELLWLESDRVGA